MGEANKVCVTQARGTLFFGVDGEENELAVFEFIHCVVETLDRHFGNVCELDIMFHLEKAHYILDEMVMNGNIVETNKGLILQLAAHFEAETK